MEAFFFRNKGGRRSVPCRGSLLAFRKWGWTSGLYPAVPFRKFGSAKFVFTQKSVSGLSQDLVKATIRVEELEDQLQALRDENGRLMTYNDCVEAELVEQQEERLATPTAFPSEDSGRKRWVIWTVGCGKDLWLMEL